MSRVVVIVIKIVFESKEEESWLWRDQTYHQVRTKYYPPPPVPPHPYHTYAFVLSYYPLYIAQLKVFPASISISAPSSWPLQNPKHQLWQRSFDRRILLFPFHNFAASSASYNISAPTTTSSTSSNTSQTSPKNTINQYGEGRHHSPYLYLTASRRYWRHIHICPAAVVVSLMCWNWTGYDRGRRNITTPHQ